jgi:hypothetical protein
MPKLSRVLNQLQTHRTRIQQELARLDAAITALRGTSHGLGKIRASKSRRTMSAAARRKIAKAQRERWAKWRTKQKKTV